MKNTAFSYFTTDDSFVMLVDHQVGTLGWVKSLPQDTVVTNCRVLAKLALAYDMPLVLTTTVEDQVGTTIPDIQEVAPDAFKARYKRDGRLSCWDDDTLAQGVAKLGRKNVILAGLTTDICLFWAAVDAQTRGYRVLVVADACGTMTSWGDLLTFDRLRDLGIEVAVVNQVVTEVANDFSTAFGQKAQKIMADEIISKLYAPA